MFQQRRPFHNILQLNFSSGSWTSQNRKIFIVENRSLTDEVLSTTMCLVEQTLNSRPLTAVSDDPEDLTALTPNHFSLRRENASAPFMPSSERYHDLRKSFKTVQAYADMIWKSWTREYLPQWNQRLKWSKEHVRNLKEGELVWLVDDSVKRCEYKIGRFIEIFTGNDGVVRSARVKMAHRELNRPVVKLAPVFYDGVSEIESRAGDFRSARKAIRQQEITFETEKLRICQISKMVKTEKFYKLGPKICTPPDFGKAKPEQPEVMASMQLSSRKSQKSMQRSSKVSRCSPERQTSIRTRPAAESDRNYFSLPRTPNNFISRHRSNVSSRCCPASDDSRCLRFLWRKDPEQRIEVYEYTRHVFGAKSSPTCALLMS